MSPQRIRLSRRKGWRKPPNTVVVARPSRWGNPFRIGMTFGAGGPNGEWSRTVKIEDRETAVAEYRRAIAPETLNWHYFPSDFHDIVRAELAGKNLACWCPLDQPCHADVLLEIANGGDDA